MGVGWWRGRHSSLESGLASTTAGRGRTAWLLGLVGWPGAPCARAVTPARAGSGEGRHAATWLNPLRMFLP